MDQKGVLLIVCGPSGVGKTTLCDALLDGSDTLSVSVSVTTRDPRPDEVDGEDYDFVSEQEFQSLRDDDAFVESATVHGNLYGTRYETLRRAWEEDDRDLLFDIDYQGARQLKESFPEATAVLIVPPSMEELRRRLYGRGSEASEERDARLDVAPTELQQYTIFDYIVVNDEFDDALETLQCIYTAARHRRRFQAGLIDDLLAEVE